MLVDCIAVQLCGRSSRGCQRSNALSLLLGLGLLLFLGIGLRVRALLAALLA